MEIKNILKAFELEAVAVDEVSKTFNFHKYSTDQVVFQEGDSSDKYYLIKSGRALVTRKTSGGEEEILNVLKEGHCFGEIGIMKNIARTATVKAIGPLELLEVERDVFLELLGNNASFDALVRAVSVRRLLSQISMFKDLDVEGVKSIQRIVVEKTYPAGEMIFEENDPADALYMIVKGNVRIFRKSTYGKEITLAYFGNDDFFGEQGLIESLPRSASAVTVEESKFMVITKENFQKLLKENAMISFNILKVLSHRMREASKEVSRAKSTSFFKGMTIIARPDRCIACRGCEIACAVAKSRTHKLYEAIYEEPLPVKRIRIRKYREGAGSEPIIRPEHCIHCHDAPCLAVCKFQAIKKDIGSNTIAIVEDKCVGCGLCARACPFNVISIIRTKGKRRMALKCTYCREHQEGPACVRCCPTNALVVALAPTGQF